MKKPVKKKAPKNKTPVQRMAERHSEPKPRKLTSEEQALVAAVPREPRSIARGAPSSGGAS